MKRFRLYITLFLCVVSHLVANSQIVYRLVDTAIGLPDDEVKGFFYAPDGRLGIRTSSGISLFDGCAFRVFSPMGAKPYQMNYVATLPRIYVDAEQRVWSKEQGQLLVFDLKREAFELHVDQVLANWGIHEPIRDFFVDETKEYWAVTVKGKLLHQGRKIALRTQGLRDICRQGDRVWMVYNDGYLVGVDARTYQVKSTARLWVKPVLARDFVRLVQKGQQLWVIWDHGVASYLPKQNRWQQRYSNDDHTFTTLALSPDGRAFLGVRQLGLVTILPNGKLSLQSSFPIMGGERVADDIQSIAYDRGNLLLGFYYKGMVLYNANMQGFPFYAFSQFLFDGLGFYRAACASDGNVSLSFPHQVLEFNPSQITLHPLPGMGAGDDFIQSFTDSRGRVWVGTFRKGIYLKDGDKVSHFIQENVPNKDMDYNIVRDFAEDHQHQIWVCYHGGVGRFDEKTKRIFPLRNKLFVGNTNINSIVFDRQHRLWAATNKGLIMAIS